MVGGALISYAPPPPVSSERQDHKKYGPNGSVRWTRHSSDTGGAIQEARKIVHCNACNNYGTPLPPPPRVLKKYGANRSVRWTRCSRLNSLNKAFVGHGRGGGVS